MVKKKSSLIKQLMEFKEFMNTPVVNRRGLPYETR